MDNETTMINGPLLQAMVLVAAKKDVRGYLNGVHVTSSRIEATNGHIALQYAVELDGLPEEGVIIKQEAIVDLFRGMSAKDKKTAVVVLDTESKELRCNGRVIGNVLIDGRYPEIDKVKPEHDAPTGLIYSKICFNWHYMSLFQKACELINGVKKFQSVELQLYDYAGANSVGIVTFTGDDRSTGLIMPMRPESK